MSAEQRASDLRVLNVLLGDEENHLSLELATTINAFADMLIALQEGRRETLTPKPRKWVNDVAEQVGIEPSLGPTDDGGPEPVRFTSGDVPRSKEVELNVGPRPLKPPGRR